MIVKKPVNVKSPDEVKANLSQLCNKAIEVGATCVMIIDPGLICLDFRARIKCIIPKCMFYGTNAHCPPNAPPIENTEKLLRSFHSAILVGVRDDSVAVVPKSGEDYKNWWKTSQLQPLMSRLNKIVGTIESEAYYQGYYFATAFSAGPCKGIFCSDIPCQALESGKRCRHMLRARSCMEGSGIDVFKTVTNVGWDIYPVGRKHRAEDLPHAFVVGLVLVD